LTWCTEDTLTKFYDEVYWKACYAHLHGFYVEFTGVMKVTGTPKSGATEWYSDDNMWAWIPIMKERLTSGLYDYVINLGADVLITQTFLHFPVWQWDEGHDITIMDSSKNLSEWGMNQNAILFKPSTWTLAFLETLYGFRKNFNLQGDNGPFMETLLKHLGHEAEANNRTGYTDDCLAYLVLQVPATTIIKRDPEEYRALNLRYSNCFYDNLDRLAGPFGHRKSNHIGFTKLFAKDQLPWANCWSAVSLYFPDYVRANCFALHWNGLQKLKVARTRLVGKCPDARFNWSRSAYNVDNPERPCFN